MVTMRGSRQRRAKSQCSIRWTLNRRNLNPSDLSRLRRVGTHAEAALSSGRIPQPALIDLTCHRLQFLLYQIQILLCPPESNSRLATTTQTREALASALPGAE